MIILTIPKLVNSVLGGATTVPYDKFVLEVINYNSVTMSVRGSIRITSTSQPDMQAITGNLTIETSTATLTVEVQQLDFYRKVILTGPQNSAVQSYIRDTQNALESGLITIGVVAGTHSTGS